jgi:hypothetical protein
MVRWTNCASESSKLAIGHEVAKVHKQKQFPARQVSHFYHAKTLLVMEKTPKHN